MRYLVALVGAGLLWAAPAQAGSTFVVAADSSGDPGYVGIGVVGSEELTGVEIGERIAGKDVELGTVELKAFGAAAPGLAYGFVKRAARWECDRLARHFNARARDPDGDAVSAGVWNRTPSCRNRLAVRVPSHVKPGRDIRVKVRDTFGSGGVTGLVCLSTARTADTCRALRMPEGSKTFRTSFPTHRRGRWHVEVKTSDQNERRTVGVGVRTAPPPVLPVVLATGDSQMQSLDAILGDELTHRAELESDVHNGSGLIQDEPVDWDTLPEEQVAKGVPDATVLALGSNDAGRMTTPDDDEVACCGEDWIDEYTRRVEVTMRRYAEGDHGTVFWLTVPAARDPRRNAAAAAVNTAVINAAQQVPRAHVLDMAALFSPKGTFQNRISYEGEKVDVRATDGVHLSIAGSAIAADMVAAALADTGVLSAGTQVRRARAGGHR
jgi:hypothetical protein